VEEIREADESAESVEIERLFTALPARDRTDEQKELAKRRNVLTTVRNRNYRKEQSVLCPLRRGDHSIESDGPTLPQHPTHLYSNHVLELYTSPCI
jgi:hypothetical protein